MVARNIFHHFPPTLLLVALVSISMPVFSQKALSKPPKHQQSVIRGKPKNSITKRSGTINGHDYVDLGLSVKWATCNVGAFMPSDCGEHFAWGETSPKSEYTEKNSFALEFALEKDDGDISGDSQYDAARANWGSTWRLPTQIECDELLYKCKWTWTTYNGRKGCKVIGPNGNSIFFPAAGFRMGTSLMNVGKLCQCYYWSSTYRKSDRSACTLCFAGGDFHLAYDYIPHGLSVRPVSE